MATRKLEVQIIGDSRSLERAFARSSKSAQGFQKNVDTAVGRADTRFRRFQSISAGGFVGGAAALAAFSAVRKSVSAAAEAQIVLGQTKVALESTGKSWEQYGQQIQDAAKAQSRLGFEDEDLLRTFSLFVRQTNDVNQALRENRLAMDIARARFISLDAAARLVNKAALGQAGALRRLGIDTKRATTGTQLLTLLTEKYGGAAQAATGTATVSFQRLQVSTRELEESVGRLLLPVLTGAVGQLNALAQGAGYAVEGLKRLAAVKVPAIHVPLVFESGGSTLGKVAGKAIFTVGDFIKLTEKVVGNLIDDFRTSMELQQPRAAAEFGHIVETFTTNALSNALIGAKKSIKAPGIKGFGTGLTPQDLYGPLVKGITPAQTEALLNAQLAGSSSAILSSLRAQQLSLRNALTDPRQSRANRITIKQALKSINDQIQTILDQAQAQQDAANQKRADARERLRQARLDAAEKARQKARAQHQAGLARAQQRQFRAIGLAPTGQELVPTISNLQKQFATLSQRVVGEAVPRNLRDRLRKVGKFLRGDLKGVTEDTRRAIKELFDTIRGTFDTESKKGGPLTKTTTLNVQRILGGVTGLDREQLRRIRANLSGFNSAGIGLAGSGSGAVNVTTNTTIRLDGDVVARAVTRHQQKTARRNPKQKRGPNR